MLKKPINFIANGHISRDEVCYFLSRMVDQYGGIHNIIINLVMQFSCSTLESTHEAMSNTEIIM